MLFIMYWYDILVQDSGRKHCKITPNRGHWWCKYIHRDSEGHTFCLTNTDIIPMLGKWNNLERQYNLVFNISKSGLFIVLKVFLSLV